jgi:hypothetical protein
MGDLETDQIRVLIANERKDRLALVAPIHPDLATDDPEDLSLPG